MNPSTKKELLDLITLINAWLSDPHDRVQAVTWRNTAAELADDYDFTEEERTELVDPILNMYHQQHLARIERKHDLHVDQMEEQEHPTIAYMDDLLARKQIEQRTPAWYEQMATILSASELGTLMAAPRQRAKLVVSKTEPPPPRNQPLAVLSEHMSAFDWGIRFEPVVKQIYEHKHGAQIKELGRLHHPIDPRCTASPDGLIYQAVHSARRGRLIEIKCPVSREMNGTIPKEYYAQMQMQLHVTGLHTCDYVEANFASAYNMVEPRYGPSIGYDGVIAVVRTIAPDHWSKEFRYLYSPLCPRARTDNSSAEHDWVPSPTELADGEEVVQLVPWQLMQWSEQMVARSEEWWYSMQPLFAAFWDDVAKAKQGLFTIPESTRPAKKPKPNNECLIRFQKMDEDGQPLEPVEQKADPE